MTAASSRRPMIVWGIVAGALLVVAALVIFLVTQREPASAGAEQTPTPAVSTPATPATPASPAAPTPAEVAPRAAEVVLAATGFTIVADDGSSMLEFLWRDDVEPVVAALTEAFGAEPALSVYPGDTTHFPDYTTYDWGGFALYDMIVSEDGKPRDEYITPSWATISANERNGVTLVPEFGLAIGETADAVRASGPDDEWPMPGDRGELRFVFDIERTDVLTPDGPVQESSYSVFVDTGIDSTVTEITYRPFSRL